jgi:hypothetical protein
MIPYISSSIIVYKRKSLPVAISERGVVLNSYELPYAEIYKHLL